MRVGEIDLGGEAEAEGASEDGAEVGGVVGLGEVAEPDAAGGEEGGAAELGVAEGEAGLAHAGGADEGEEADAGSELAVDGVERAGPTDEATEGRHEVRLAFARAHRGTTATSSECRVEPARAARRFYLALIDR